MSSKIRSIRELLRFSGNKHLGREEKTIPCLEKIYNNKKNQAELNELRQTVLLKQSPLDILISFQN